MPDQTETTGSTSLIDDGFDANNSDDTATDTTDDKTTDGATDTGTPTLDHLVAQAVAKIEEKFDSVLDRRVNQTLKAIERRAGKPGTTDDTADPATAANRNADTTTGPGPDVARAARTATREYLGDHIRFVSPEERALASELVNAAIAGASDIGDEDRFGRDTARKVAETIKALRGQYEALTLAGLRKRGGLVEKPGQTPGAATGTKDPGSEMAEGARIAARLRPVPQPAAQQAG